MCAPRVAVAAVLVAAVQSAAAFADERPPDAGGVALDVVGACPERAAFERILAGLPSPTAARGAAVSLEDRGPQYRIAVGDHVTTLDDPVRDCAARARVAAVVVANDLRAHAQVFGPPEWTVEKGLVFDYTSSGTAGGAWGAEFRGAWGRGLLSVMGAAGARGAVTLTFADGWKAELLRFPLDVGVRMTSYRWRLRPWLGVGPSLTVMGVMGESPLDSDRHWRIDPGAVVLAGATLPVRKRMGVAAALNVRWQPRPYRIEVVPAGITGETPTWWIGVSLNYTIDATPTSQ
jgi:hypothetical protein